MPAPTRISAALRLSPDTPRLVYWANVVSYLINPLVLPPVAFWLILHHFGASVGEKTAVVSTALVFFTLAPLAFFVWMVRSGKADTVEIRDRTRRTPGFLAGMASYAAALGPLFWFSETVPPLVVALVLVHLVNTGVLLLITFRWKISVHLAGLSGFFSMLLFVANTSWSLPAAFLSPLWLWVGLLTVPLLGWARVRAGAHTVGQVIGGAIVGFALPYSQLSLAYVLGLMF